MAESDVLAAIAGVKSVVDSIEAKIDIIQSEIVAIKTETDKLEFYPYYTVSGTLTPNVAGDYFFYTTNAYGNVFKNYLGDFIEATSGGFSLYRGVEAIWTCATLTGSYTASTGATGTATVAQKYCSVVHPDLVTLSETRYREVPSIIDERTK